MVLLAPLLPKEVFVQMELEDLYDKKVGTDIQVNDLAHAYA